MDGRKDCLVHLDDDVEWRTPDGIFIKGMILVQRDIKVAQHSHSYAHTSLVAKGSVRVWKEGAFFGDFKAPSIIPIEARAKHMFQSLESDTAVYCIHNMRGSDRVSIHEYVTEAPV